MPQCLGTLVLLYYCRYFEPPDCLAWLMISLSPDRIFIYLVCKAHQLGSSQRCQSCRTYPDAKQIPPAQVIPVKPTAWMQNELPISFQTPTHLGCPDRPIGHAASRLLPSLTQSCMHSHGRRLAPRRQTHHLTHITHTQSLLHKGSPP